MKLFKINASSVSIVLFVALALSSQLVVCANEKFSISKDRKSAKAVVGAKKEFTVKFDPPLTSKVEGYKDKTFFLIFGSCRMDIFSTIIIGQDKVIFDITDPSVSRSSTTNNPKWFKVTANEVKFDGAASNCKNSVKFETYPGDANKFLVEVSLDGNFPPSLVLKSDDATLYDDSAKDSNKQILPVWAWVVIGVSGSILVLILLIVATVVLVCIKCRKKKTTQSDPTLHTAIEKANSKELVPTATEESKKVDRKKKSKGYTASVKQTTVIKDKEGVEESAKANKVSQIQHVSVKPEKVLQIQKQVSQKESKISSQPPQQPSVVKNPTSEPPKNPPPTNNRLYMRPSAEDDRLSTESIKDRDSKKPLPRDRLYMKPSNEDQLSPQSIKAESKKPEKLKLKTAQDDERTMPTQEDEKPKPKKLKLKTAQDDEGTMPTQDANEELKTEKTQKESLQEPK